MYNFLRKNITSIFVFFFFLFAAIFITWPLVFSLDKLTPGVVDELYITWILNWITHAIISAPNLIFHGNMFHPYPYTISYSDFHFTSALIGLIPVVITKQPMVAYNFNLILAFSLTGFSTYLLTRHITKDTLSSIIAGTIFAFSTFFISKNGQLQVVAIYWVPLSILFFLKYCNTKKFRIFLFSIIFFYLQFLNSFLPAYFLIFAITCLAIYEIKSKKIKASLLFNKKVIFLLILTISLSIPVIYPYFYTSEKFNYTRDIREAIHTANRPEYFFYSYGHSKVGTFLSETIYKTPKSYTYDGYRGLANIILAFVLIVFLFIKKKKPKYLNAFSFIALSCYVISLGPALQIWGHVIKHPFIIPLPYAVLYYVAPGFKGFRNSGRWETFEIFAASIAIGIMLASVLKNRSKLRKVIFIIIILSVFVEFKFPFKFYNIEKAEEIPASYKFVQTLPQSAVLAEFPLYNWDIQPYSFTENKRLYYSSIDHRKRLNGAAGFSPPPWQELARKLFIEFPSEKSIIELKKIGVEYLFIHLNEYDQMNKDKFVFNNTRISNGKMVKTTLDKSQNLILIYNSKSDAIYKIIK